VLDSLALLEELYQIIENNWQRSRPFYCKPPSKENWRVMRRPQFAQYNISPEVTLERHIVQATEHWVNQVPTSSGLTGPRYDKARNIDLAHNLGPGEWEFIELKVNSDTPLYAAMEILQYGLLFLFSRRHQEELGCKKASKIMLQASQIHLKVLAPSQYYLPYQPPQQYQLQWLEESLNEGLQQFVDGSHQAPLQMDFQFEAFSPDFIWPPANGGTDPDDLRTALRDRYPVYAYQHIFQMSGNG
jgi:hypothetical protein